MILEYLGLEFEEFKNEYRQTATYLLIDLTKRNYNVDPYGNRYSVCIRFPLDICCHLHIIYVNTVPNNEQLQSRKVGV